MRRQGRSLWARRSDSGRANPITLVIIGVMWIFASFAPWIEYGTARRLASQPLLHVREVYWAVENGRLDDVYVVHPTLGDRRIQLLGVPDKLHAGLEDGVHVAPERSVAPDHEARDYKPPLSIRYDSKDGSAMAESDIRNPGHPIALALLTLCGTVPLVIAHSRATAADGGGWLHWDGSNSGDGDGGGDGGD